MLLEMKNICKDFLQGGETVHVLKRVNLSIEQGDYLAIMGPSGSGKTTLMNIIGCLDVPTSGTYRLNGENLPRPQTTGWRTCETPPWALCSRAFTSSPA